MTCLSQAIDYVSFALERLGLYNRESGELDETRHLLREASRWKRYRNESFYWDSFHLQYPPDDELHPLVDRAITYLSAQGIENGGVAVDLGCGVSPTAFYLLEREWRVYDVDYSEIAMQRLERKIAFMRKNWIANTRLILVRINIENFRYPEKVHLITAINSLPYCNPEKIHEVFSQARMALLPRGVFACTLFTYEGTSFENQEKRRICGSWMITKKVAESLIRSAGFTSWSISMEPHDEVLWQLHIIAQA